MPAHDNLEGYLDAYIQAAGIQHDRKGPLFRRVRKNDHKTLTAEPLDRHYILPMVKRRTRTAGMSPDVCNHSFRASDITMYLKNGGTLEKVQYMASHESARTTRLYDRRQDEVSLDEVERIAIQWMNRRICRRGPLAGPPKSSA